MLETPAAGTTPAGAPQAGDDPLVPVYVRASQLQAVYAFVAGLGDTPAAAAGTEGGADLEELLADELADGQAGPWSDADLTRIATSKLRSLVGVSAILDRLAAEPGVRVSTEDLLTTTGMTHGGQRAALSSFTRHLRAYFPGNRWPMNTEWGPKLGLDAQVYYSMPADLAEQWQRVRGTDA